MRHIALRSTSLGSTIDAAPVLPPVALWTAPRTPEVPRRLGDLPVTRPHPHTQMNQRPKWNAVERVYSAALALPGAQSWSTPCGPPGTLALRLVSHVPKRDGAQMLVAREFMHFHPLPHGSVHLALPAELRDEAIAAGWAEPHPLAGHAGISPLAVMVYAPRSAAEADVVIDFVRASWELATGART